MDPIVPSWHGLGPVNSVVPSWHGLGRVDPVVSRPGNLNSELFIGAGSLMLVKTWSNWIQKMYLGYIGLKYNGRARGL